VAKNVDFQKELKDIEELVERKKRKSISLNEAVRKAELAKSKDDKDRDESKTAEGTENKDIFPTDFYNDEVLAITADYVAMLRGLNTARN
jgi:carboxyl-terminal processing protease